MPRKTASKSPQRPSSVEVAPEALTVPRLDAADAQQPVDLGLRETVRGLVGGDAVFVETARLGARLEQRDVMSEHRQPVRTGEPRRPRADHRDPLAGRLARA
jgi:hypothetical protein